MAARPNREEAVAFAHRRPRSRTLYEHGLECAIWDGKSRQLRLV